MTNPPIPTPRPLPEEPESPPADAEAMQAVRLQQARDIDEAVKAIYARFTPLIPAYEAREAEAIAFQAAGYVGDTPPLVAYTVNGQVEHAPPLIAGYAAPAGLTAVVATNQVLAQAVALRGAIPQLENLRMQKRFIVRGDVSDAIALACFIETMAAIAALGAQLA